MCSIVGYNGQLFVAPLLVDSLKRMEYRGYDSVGIATINNGKILLKKGVGKVLEVDGTLDLKSMEGFTGIGHTRWATHGGVTEINAHPHYCCTDSIAIAHNGIIENHRELKEELIELGHVFKSDTDSEVIAHLLENYYNDQKNLKKSIMKTCSRLKGAYAFVAAFENGTICGSRYNEPLIIGTVDTGNFLSSDILGFIEFTDKAIFLDNRDIVILDSNTYQIYDSDGKNVDRTATQVAWELAAIDKGKYSHHTLKEIHEQPKALEKVGISSLDKIEEFCKVLSKSKTVFLTGSGTSYHCALIAKHLLSNFGKIHAETLMSSEFQYTLAGVDNSSVLLAFSQSGETADVLHAVKAAKQMGAKILSIVNVSTSSLARISDSFLVTSCGPEVGVAATKSFTTQLSLVYMIADRLCNGCLGFSANRSLVIDAICEVLDSEKEFYGIAEKIHPARDIYVLGRSIHYPIALEGALKIKELSYIHAEGIAAGELKHGPLALIDRDSYVIILNPSDSTSDRNIASAHEIKARGATIIGISDLPNEVYDIFIKIPKIPSIECGAIYPIIEVIPLQILAYYLSLVRNIDPDYPRNLAKSVTVM
jgi:glutamine---fructose-6-phosphate transaminase (isomerizing)